MGGVKVDGRGGGEWGQMEVDGVGWDEGGWGVVRWRQRWETE